METGVGRPVGLGIGIAVVAIVGLFLVFGNSGKDNANTLPGLTEVTDPAALQKTVQLSHLGILTSTNYIGQKIYLVRATLKNVSDKPVRVIDLKMTFFDYNKKFIKDEVRNGYGVKQKPLEPGTEYRVELAFENPPSNWNYHVPDTIVVKAAY
jgi:hypothetical protein